MAVSKRDVLNPLKVWFGEPTIMHRLLGPSANWRSTNTGPSPERLLEHVFSSPTLVLVLRTGCM